MILVRLAALVCLGLMAGDARAQSLTDARTAYAEGRFIEAAELAEALGTSEGFALAAQSLSVYAHFVASEDEWDPIVKRAMRLGEAAVRADSTSSEAYQQAAHALGRYSQGIGTLSALRQGVANELRERLDAAIALDPYAAGARMALGAWHADIDAAGFIARRLYGGNRAAAIVLFEQALDLEPDQRDILYEYAIRLPYLDEERGEERALEVLEEAAQLPVIDAYDGFIQELVLAELEARTGG